jgi:predicted transcriptional regulator
MARQRNASKMTLTVTLTPATKKAVEQWLADNPEQTQRALVNMAIRTFLAQPVAPTA